MSKKILKTGSVPADLGRNMSKDDLMDEEYDKIFHPERFEQAIPAEEGNVTADSDRAKYYRSGSIDEAGDGSGYNDQETNQRRESAKREALHHDSAMNVHAKPEFAHPHNPLMKMKHGSHGKHRKSSDPGVDHVRKKEKNSRKVSNRPDFSEIPEGEQEKEVYEEKSEDEKEDYPWGHDEDADENKGVKFTLGHDEDEDSAATDRRKSHHRRPRGNSIPMGERKAGSELLGPELGQTNMSYEDQQLMEGDKDDLVSRRFEKPQGLMEHKISHERMLSDNKEPLTLGDIRKPQSYPATQNYGYRIDVDHTPHELFVEMDELEGDEWVERARWIKYEEDLEADVGKWGKPHVASLSFHSLINLRRCLEGGTMLLDISARDLPQVLHRVVEDLSEKGIIVEDQKSRVLGVLLYRHKHVHPHNSTFKFGLKRSLSQRSIQGLLEGDGRRSSVKSKKGHDVENGVDKENLVDANANGVNGAAGGMKKSATSGSFRREDSWDNLSKARKRDILNCLEDGTEGCIVLVGSLEDIDHPIVAFVRLGEALVMPNTIEVSLPVRFIFILLVPAFDLNMDHHEIGRSFSTLMSNPTFHNVCYGVKEKRELLHAINAFLDESVVLPPGDWDKKALLSMPEIMEMRNRAKGRKALLHKEEAKNAVESDQKKSLMSVGGGGDPGKPPKDDENEKAKAEEAGEGGEEKRNPLARTSTPFGGLIGDIKHRHLKSYLSDFKDGLNAQVIAATIFIYFAALSGAIAFGGLMGAKTKNLIGISETLILSSVMGVVFGLFAGCPLIIIGTTGPVLLYDEALFGFSETSLPGQFLAWRVWIGIWTFIIALVVAGFQGSTVVKFFTKFTKDIFNSLVSILFIYEAIRKLVKIFNAHPMISTPDYCEHHKNMSIDCRADFEEGGSLFGSPMALNSSAIDSKCDAVSPDTPQPNTALLSFILMFGTFFIAYFLRNFRNSQFLGRTVRRALGDFGVPIAIVIMVLIDNSFGDTFTEKLSVPEGISVTNSSARGWLINPSGDESAPLAVWAMFAAVLPAMLLYMLLFMETHICELIMMEKTKEAKGAGLHLDIVLLAFINLICGIFGGPWICAATVRAVSHVSALTVMSTANVPGEAPKVIGVRDQRVSATMVSILLGLSVLMAPILKLVPFAVLFGVFLYMGVAGMNGVQFFDRLTLFVKPVKHHPNVSYVKRVPTWRMCMFTIFQFFGLVLLWVVKSTPAALAFPFFVMLMIPYRFLLKYIFTECELEALDGATAGKDLSGEEDEEHDFYETANECPITPATQAPLHRSLMALAVLPTKIGGLGMPLKKEQV